jgi:hypothetical protein
MFLPDSSAAVAQFKVIYAFRLSTDGGFPGGGVVADAAGNLYGTTEGGGNAYGTVYKLTPPSVPGAWTEITLHSFKNASDGLYPEAGLVFDNVGNLYGTAPNGGDNACIGGCGTVFRLSPPTVRGGPWKFTVLYSFKGNRDGYRPYWGSLILDAAGNIYGTTVYGGNPAQCSGFGCGAVFELTRPIRPGRAWTERILHRFGSGSDGATPFSGLILGGRGNLYGMTQMGGAFANGVVFRLVPPVNDVGSWTEEILYQFGSRSFDGLLPTAKLVFDGAGRLYGTTQSGGNGCTGDGCGTVFRLTPPPAGHIAWTEDILHSFTNTDGEEPEVGVIFDRAGNIYSSTYIGGFNGTIFRLARQGGVWVEKTLHQFTGSDDGQGPVGDLIGRRRIIYGVTHSGGASGAGTVFEIRL